MTYKVSDVFVPGGTPRYTYVPRVERKLEEKLALAHENLCKLVTVTGTTKSGKSVLASRIFPRTESVWIDGGTIGDESDFWEFILSEIGGFTDVTSESVFVKK